jgi:small GTP-binding protein
MSILFCSCCKEEYGDNDDSEYAPKVLSCGHTFCCKCIKDKMINNDEITCYNCQKEDGRTFENIPFNRILYDMLLKESVQKNVIYDIPKQKEKCDLTLNIGLIGNCCVGKTTISKCYEDNKPCVKENNYKATVSLDFYKRIVNKNGKRIYIKIWDTAGLEKFNSVTAGYLRGLHACFIVFDVTDRYSFEHLNEWIQLYCNFNQYPEKVLFLLGNKIDKQNRTVSFEEGNNFAKEKDIPYFETSAMTMKNINEAFDKMINYILEVQMDDMSSRKSSKVNMSKIINKKKPKKIETNKDRCC